MGLALSEKEKKLLLIAKKKGFKGLTQEEKIAVLKYKKILAQQKAKATTATAKKPTTEKQPTKEAETKASSDSSNILTPQDKQLILSAKKKGMKNLTPQETQAILKYKRLLKAQKSTQTETKEAKETTSESKPKKLLIVKEQIPDIPNVKKEHFGKFKGKRVLIVEDNLINQKMLKAILAGTGIDALFAENGKVALKHLAKGEKFDLVLMDIEMPELDGLSATKMIRKSKHFANLPIIALTSSSKKEDIIKILKSGMNGYIFKPVALGRLYNAFRLFMGDKK